MYESSGFLDGVKDCPVILGLDLDLGSFARENDKIGGDLSKNDKIYLLRQNMDEYHHLSDRT